MTTQPPPQDLRRIEQVTTGLDPQTLRRDFLFNLFTRQAKFLEVATKHDLYMALAYTVRDRMMLRLIRSEQAYFERASRTVAYLSAEYLIGPQLGHNLVLLGILDAARQALGELDVSLDELLEHETEPGLGNGGLGRLAACYADSLAALRIPAIGYGMHYEFGIFRQEILNGEQVEAIDHWGRHGFPWEIEQLHQEYTVMLGGHVEHVHARDGRHSARWQPARVVKGIAHDIPVLGYEVENTNLLRLWEAVAAESLNLTAFNQGEYYRAVDEKVLSENISKVLYPNDQPDAGKALRLEQEYFFVSCSLQDMIRIFLQRESNFERFSDKYAIQLNDTHPAVAIAELMRLLVDEHGLEWNKAFEITKATCGYTNHTLLPEALERWPLWIFKRLLPRHLEIIYELNHRFLNIVRHRFPGDDARLARLSLLGEDDEIRMANLACLGSHAINGVSELHTRLLKETVLRDFHELWPHKFSNKTNGITPRRFVVLANPGLSALLTQSLGPNWARDHELLRGLEPLARDSSFVDAFRTIRRANKVALAEIIKARTGVTVDPDSLFDLHVKRIHEYKRQHLNVLHVITLYRHLKEGRELGDVPRTVIISGKAAPGYFMAKLIIRLIHDVGRFINEDRTTRDRLRLVFIPNFSVKVAQHIYPAADLAEQISTAGKEASGTGNMKFAMNGAVTIGTLDGANVEIRDAVGEDNFFLFGLTADEVSAKVHAGYRPAELYANNAELRATLDLIAHGMFSDGDRGRYAPLLHSLLQDDPFMLLADFDAFIESQKQVSRCYANKADFARKGILNLARSGRFSSDRAIAEYCAEIWNVKPVDVSTSVETPPAEIEPRVPLSHTRPQGVSAKQ
jgi:glycogen phosphorylase